MRENDLYEVASSSLEVVHAMFRESPVENTTHFDRFERSYSPRRSYRVHLYTLLLFDDISVQNYKSMISNYASIKAYFSEKQKYGKYGSVLLTFNDGHMLFALRLIYRSVKECSLQLTNRDFKQFFDR